MLNNLYEFYKNLEKQIEANQILKGRGAENFRALTSQGFTLIEILIVMGLIGVISIMIIGPIRDRLDKSNIEKTRLTMTSVMGQINLYQNDCGRVPPNLEAMKDGDPECKNWGPAYLKDLPKDGWNRPFIFESDGVNYSLKSLGKDGKEGGTGANKDLDSNEL